MQALCALWSRHENAFLKQREQAIEKGARIRKGRTSHPRRKSTALMIVGLSRGSPADMRPSTPNHVPVWQAMVMFGKRWLDLRNGNENKGTMVRNDDGGCAYGFKALNELTRHTHRAKCSAPQRVLVPEQLLFVS